MAFNMHHEGKCFRRAVRVMGMVMNGQGRSHLRSLECQALVCEQALRNQGDIFK
jgi:hypothetical protein